MTEAKIKERIHKLVTQHFQLTQKQKKFIPGKSMVQYAGAVYDERDLNAMVDTMLKGWFGLGHEGEALEKELEEYMGVKKAFLTNSGSSSDLLAVSSLMSYQFANHLNPGDEVITPVCTFPTAVSALIHNRLKPVFVDVDPDTLNPTAEDIAKAVGPKTRAILLVHTLGNPNDMTPIMKIAKENKLYVIEDNCDSLGSTYEGKKTGTFGIFGTESFYPAHHMTTAGEGGAVFLNDMRFLRITQSIREWGRACWCGASGGGTLGVCGVRFNYKVDNMPYDHKYIFNHIGYNIKPVEIQAAMGRIQLKKVGKFIKARKKNFDKYYEYFKKYEDYFILPKALSNADPSWFAFPLTIRKGVKFDRFKLTFYLEEKLIQTRPLFTGNILKQPGFKNIERREAGDFRYSNHIHSNTFFIGVYPGLTSAHISYVMDTIDAFMKQNG